MAEKSRKPTNAPAIPDHRHDEVAEHGHPVPDHDHGRQEHEHPHDHPVPDHQHDHEHGPARHEHRDLHGHLRGSVRALLAVLEASSLNTEQQRLMHQVRVIIGDAHGRGCPHENTVYEEGDRLICQDCREDVTPASADAGG